MTRGITWRRGSIYRSTVFPLVDYEGHATFIERTYTPKADGEPPITRRFDFEIEGVMREA